MRTQSVLSLCSTSTVLAALALALSMAAGCKRAPAAAPASPATAEPRTVVLVPVIERPVDRSVEVTGTLYGQEEVTIAAEVGGRVVQIGADLGDVASHGTQLASIDPTNYELAVEEQRAALLTALARIGLDAVPTGDVDLDALPVVARARAQAENARSRLERARKLYERTPPLISEQDFADIQTQFEVATTSVGVERLSAKSLVAEARVRASALRQAERRLAETRILAPAEKPLTYRVAARQISVGEVVTPGQAMFRLVVSDRVKFRGQVPERYVRDVVVGAPAELVASSSPNPFAATIARISPTVDIRTRSFEVEVEAENANGLLKPGSFMLARLRTGSKVDARFIPESAVLQFAGVQRVFSVRQGKVAEHRVRLGKLDAGMREVLDGLDGVTEVVDHPRGLSAGMAAQVAPAAAR
jgi:RND family efflux transporter MFP subunit